MPPIQRPSLPTLAALMILLVVLGGFVPAIFGNTQNTEIETIHQTAGETVVLQSPLEATLVNVNENPGRVNVTIIDAKTGNITATGTLNEGDSTTIQIEDNDVTVSYLTAIDTTTATISYEYPVLYEQNSTITAFISVIAVIMLLIFVYMIFVLIQPEDKT